jgi:hypothetical protein
MNVHSTRLATIVAATLLSGAVFAEESDGNRPDEDRDYHHTSLELGARLGYSIPWGNISGNDVLGDTAENRIPLLVELGLRFRGRLLVGMYLGYSAVNLSSNGLFTSGNIVDVGLQAAFHMNHRGWVDPWIGGGIGWEIFNYHQSVAGVDFSGDVNGVSFKLDGGIDFMLIERTLGLGPFVAITFAQYNNCDFGGSNTNCSIPDQRWHGWFTVGARGYYDIGL